MHPLRPWHVARQPCSPFASPAHPTVLPTPLAPPQIDFFSTKNGTELVWGAIEQLIESGVDPELVAALNDTATVGAWVCAVAGWLGLAAVPDSQSPCPGPVWTGVGLEVLLRMLPLGLLSLFGVVVEALRPARPNVQLAHPLPHSTLLIWHPCRLCIQLRQTTALCLTC